MRQYLQAEKYDALTDNIKLPVVKFKGRGQLNCVHDAKMRSCRNPALNHLHYLCLSPDTDDNSPAPSLHYITNVDIIQYLSLFYSTCEINDNYVTFDVLY